MTADINPAESGIQEIDRFLRQGRELARSDVATVSFYQRLLELLVGSIGAAGGAIWLRNTSGSFAPEHQIDLSASGLVDTPALQASHARLLQSVLESDEARTISARSGQIGNSDWENPSAHVLVLCPVAGNVGVIELFLDAALDLSVLRGAEQLAEVASQYIVEHQHSRSFRQLETRDATRSAEREFTDAIHQSLDLERTAYVLANEGRRFTQCDRVSVLVRRGARCQVLAISGVDTIARRSNVVRHLQTLGERVLASGQPLWFQGDFAELPPEVEAALHAYLDEQPSRTVMVLPLDDAQTDNAAYGVVVVESLQVIDPTALSDQLRALTSHGHTALRNAGRYDAIPLRRLLAPFSQLMSWRWRTALGSLAVIAVVTVLLLYPVNFQIRARGRIVPVKRHDIFAPIDGEIVSVEVNHDEQVAANDLLATLRSAELNRAFQQVEGKKNTVRQQIASLDALRVEGDTDDPLHARRIAAQLTEANVLLGSYEKELVILRGQRDKLTLQAPHAGKVVTWDVDRLLEGRPVRRGQLLMTVAQTTGRWMVELHVPDDDFPHVAQMADGDATLTASFMLLGSPRQTYTGRVTETGTTVLIDEDNTPYVLATVTLDDAQLAFPKPDARGGTDPVWETSAWIRVVSRGDRRGIDVAVVSDRHGGGTG